jgi:hypothetical protein
MRYPSDVAKPKRLVEGIDYYLEDGKMVLTSHFLLARGYCCNSGCRHCPYGERESPPMAVAIVGLPGRVTGARPASVPPDGMSTGDGE